MIIRLLVTIVAGVLASGCTSHRPESVRSQEHTQDVSATWVGNPELRKLIGTNFTIDPDDGPWYTPLPPRPAVNRSSVINSSGIPLLSIHLVRDDQTVIEEPVLADPDFAAFDAFKHTFAITPDAAERLARGLWELRSQEPPQVYRTGEYHLIPGDFPFVLRASGEHVYSGWFSTLLSSRGFFGTPTIYPMRLFISTNQSANVEFSIECPGCTNTPSGLLNLGRPLTMTEAADLIAPDMRNDKRIITAVDQLFSTGSRVNSP